MFAVDYTTFKVHYRHARHVPTAHLLLSLPHGQELEAVSSVPHPVCQFPQIPGRISTRTQDKHNRRLRCGLVVHVIEANDGRGDILFPHPASDKVGDGSVDAVHPEAAKEEELLDV